jgi:AraC-like DNA-binding protein
MGMVPKDYLKIIRFSHACQLMGQYPHADWFDIVCECGYYDQMHFIHEFKSIMGCPPQKFLEQCKGQFYFLRPFIIVE